MLDTYSFSQLAVHARAIMGHHARILNMLIGPVLASQGIAYDPIKIDAAASGAPATDKELAAKENAKLRAVSASPFRVKTVKTSVDKEPEPG